MEVRSIGVVGAGKMGSGISVSAARAGFDVVIHEKSPEDLERGIAQVEAQLSNLEKKGSLSVLNRSDVCTRINTTTAYVGFDNCDLVIEAIPESLELKMALFAELDRLCKSEAIFASNTSTLSITALASVTKRPAQCVGMHFFIPPTRLVEIVRGAHTSDDTARQVRSVADRMGRVTVLVNKDTPGFIANRVYTPLFLEAFRIYEEGIASIEDIDLAMKNSYLPIGPFELADIIGLDVLDAGFDYYQSQLGPTWKPSRTFTRLVQEGRIGKKVGKGWYDY
jgi:3-hydroxybutyryl-CoA dehydrogenase